MLLRNENGALPLSPTTLQKVAVIGLNVKAIVLGGGGSAPLSLMASFFASPYESMVKALKEARTEAVYSEGAQGRR